MPTQPSPADVNTLSEFLSNSQLSPQSLPSSRSTAIAICVSAVLHPAETLFAALQSNPNLTETLILCGGIGHSTPYLYDAVAAHPRYGALSNEIQGLPESRVLYRIFEKFFDGKQLVANGLRVLVEDRSTNCGANALETRKILAAHDIPTPDSMLIVQDPTMSLRTLASFQKAFAAGSPVEFTTAPLYVPLMKTGAGGMLEFVREGGVRAEGLWSVERFLDLLVGEIPRLRDDESGYGPNGKGFIAHVDVPGDVEAAWERIRGCVARGR